MIIIAEFLAQFFRTRLGVVIETPAPFQDKEIAARERLRKELQEDKVMLTPDEVNMNTKFQDDKKT